MTDSAEVGLERDVKRDLRIAILALAKVESGWHPPPIQVIHRKSRDREDQDGRRHFEAVRASTHCREIRVIDLSQPLDADTAVIQLPPEFGKPGRSGWRKSPNTISGARPGIGIIFPAGEHTGTHFDAPIHWVTGKDFPTECDRYYSSRKFLCACLCDRCVALSRRRSGFPAYSDSTSRSGSVSMGASKLGPGC